MIRMEILQISFRTTLTTLFWNHNINIFKDNWYHSFFVCSLCMWTLKAVLVFFSTPQCGQEWINPLKCTSACLLICDLSDLLLPQIVHSHTWLSGLYSSTSLMVLEKSKTTTNLFWIKNKYFQKSFIFRND